MRKDPKSGDVFDYVEPPEPKVKGVIYKFVEGMGSDARGFASVFCFIALFGIVAALCWTIVSVTKIVYAPQAKVESPKSPRHDH